MSRKLCHISDNNFSKRGRREWQLKIISYAKIVFYAALHFYVINMFFRKSYFIYSYMYIYLFISYNFSARLCCMITFIFTPCWSENNVETVIAIYYWKPSIWWFTAWIQSTVYFLREETISDEIVVKDLRTISSVRNLCSEVFEQCSIEFKYRS